MIQSNQPEGVHLLIKQKSILISCPHENVSTKFLAPYTTFPRIHQKSVTCLDISSGGGLGVSTSTDGTMKIWQAANGEIRGLCFHAGILDTAIVDRGRNVLSCSRDGTARLWDCGKSACLGVIADCGCPINGIAVGTANDSLNLGSPETPPSEREVGTEGKILLLAREDGKLQGVGLQSRQPLFLFVGSDAFNCCTFLSSTSVLAGTQDGNIYQLDVRNTNTPIQVIHRSGAPVLSLLPYRDGFIASQEFFAEDGSEVLPPFGGPRGRGALRKDPPVIRDLYVSLEDLFHGCTKKIKISRRVMNEDGLTSTIRDKILTIDVQPGWKRGTRVTFEKEGDQGPNVIPADIIFVVQEKLHPRFKRADNNLIYVASIPLGKALTGCTLDVWTLDGRLLNIPINDIVDPKYCKVVPGEGMPLLQDPQCKGDLLIYFDISFPKSLSPETKTVLKNVLLPEER
ncbi:hypothetical protein WISP_58477 [Willisornis vidua]|uniref:Chaperone DnaJ C-terminal domain-containing protein n=1 Tax=Willisornis vidua TaxID=1566151 RepID=A0ABQ9DH08_9PASS|nr:hypothetical protein WISP_58477 [Willisornis vidua]